MKTAHSTPFFSVIIPTYNRVHIIGGAIESVRQQSFENWELIVIDDGSTDETAAAVAEYQEDKRVKYVWQKNGELNKARNRGVQEAQGIYLCFLDDDDVFYKNHLAALFECIKAKETPIAAFKTGMIIERKGGIKTASEMFDDKTESALSFVWHRPINLLSFAFHRAIFEKIQFDDKYILADDMHFLIGLVHHFPMYQVDEHTVEYRWHEQARTVAYFQKHQLENKIACIKDIWAQYASSMEETLGKSALTIFIVQQYLHFSRAALQGSEIKLAWHYFGQALCLFQWSLWKNYAITLVKIILATLGIKP